MSGITDPRQEAISYMEQKNVFKLFDFLGAQLAKEKPDDPNDFLLSELRRIVRLKEAGKPVSFILLILIFFCFCHVKESIVSVSVIGDSLLKGRY